MATRGEELEMLRRRDGVLGKARNDEPLFILRAQDRLAPSLVESWADLAVALGTPVEKIREARELAAAMKRWAEKHGAKSPD